MVSGQGTNSLGKFQIPRRIIGHQWQAADPHRVVGGNRRQAVVFVNAGEAADCHGMRRMEMHDSAGARPLVVHRRVEKGFLGRLVTVDVLAKSIELRDPGWVERAER